MFTIEQRTKLRSDLLQYAETDKRITGSAITGSASANREDRWSDIDLAFGVASAAAVPNVLSDWTAYMYAQHSAVHHVDVRAGAWIYRVFLLANTLQVDLAFVAADEFRALSPTFRLVQGEANPPRHVPPPEAVDIVGMGWLYALHARSAIARGKLWQAVYMINGVRDHALALACLRHGVSTSHARGVDELPLHAIAEFEGSLVRYLETDEVSRAFEIAVAGLLSEITLADRELASRIEETVRSLADVYSIFSK